MRRALALTALELRTERRYGIHATGVVLAVLWTAVLLVIPAEAARFAAPLVLFVDTATVGVFLAGAIVLFERGERALAALLASPVRTAEYLAAKVAALTVLSLAIAVPVALAGARGRFPALPVLAGVGLTALLMLLLALGLVARHRSIVGFLSAAPWPLIPLMGVPLAHGVGLVEHPLAYLVPTTAAVDLIDVAFGGVAPPPPAVAYLVACVAAAGVWAVRRFDRLVRAGGG
ncbi:MAG TPA: hypothetical protein VM287_09855 [Egibacteraceae bacterium]|nr:hypothetical protein [Egibacteraceae bacterium]